MIINILMRYIKNNQYFFNNRRERKIRLFHWVAALLILFSTAVFMGKSDYEEWLVEDGIDPVLTLADLGYEDIQAPKTSLYSLTFNTEKIADCYKIALYGEENSSTMNLTVYLMDEAVSVNTVFENRVEEKYTSIYRGSGRNDYKPKVKYERIVAQAAMLDTELWSSEKAYAIHELNKPDNQFNLLFLQRERQIVIIKVDSEFIWTSECIMELIQCLDKLDL